MSPTPRAWREWSARPWRPSAEFDILVNNAAIYPYRPWHEISEAEWDRVFAVNIKGQFLCAQAVYPHLKSAGRDGIRVNCLVLGHVYSPMGVSGGDDLRERRRLAGLLGTEATAWDVAWPAVFLASEESRWITGVALPVDAGTTAATALGVETLNGRDPDLRCGPREPRSAGPGVR